MMNNQGADGWDAVKTLRGWVYFLHDDRRLRLRPLEVALYLVAIGLLYAFSMGVLGGGVWLSRRGELKGGELIFLLLVASSFLAGSLFTISLLRRQLGRYEISLDADVIRATWRFGALSWSKAVPRSKVAQLAVVRRTKSMPPDMSSCGEFHVLTAEDQNGRRTNLLAHHPRSLLLALAVDLSSHAKTPAFDPDLLDVGAKKLAVVEDTEIPIDVRERPRPPLGTRVIFEDTGTYGARITRPPERIFSSQVVFTALTGLLLLSLAAFVGISPYKGGIDGTLTIEHPVIWLVLAPLAFCGLSLLLSAFKLVCTESILLATPDFLAFVSTGLTWTSCSTWTRQEIASIHADVRFVDSTGKGEGSRLVKHLLIDTYVARTPDAFARVEKTAPFQLLRKPRGAPDSEFLGVGTRGRPGEIVDRVPLAVGRYDYAVREETLSLRTGQQSLSSVDIELRWPVKLDLGTDLSKPELEWIATTLRGMLGVPASSGPSRV